MADEESKPPVTDSRFPGFNPEVEASHAETNAAQAKAAAEAAAATPQPPPPPIYTHRCRMCGALYEYELKDCISCGATASVDTLPSKAE